MSEERGRHSTWVTVDLGAIKEHIRFFLDRSQVRVMAVVKANAYGHGAVPVAKAALEAGASFCGVARVDEALELRQAGIHSPILILGYTPEDRYGEMIDQRVSMTVWDINQVENIAAVASRQNQEARLHLKVDTGMSRLGADPSEVMDMLEKTTALPGVRLEGMFTHFACADESDPAPTDRQQRRFLELLARLNAAGVHIPVVHAANSAASLTRPGLYFNCVRVGIAMYGLHPSAQCPLPAVFRPVLTWKSVLGQVKVLPAGRGISYGHEYVTTREERIGTVPVGYADGFRRVPGNQVLVRGRRVPVVGRVTMDQVMVQLDAAPQAAVGDEVVILGSQGEESIPAEEIATRWGTINYEVTCGIAHRVARIY